MSCKEMTCFFPCHGLNQREASCSASKVRRKSLKMGKCALKVSTRLLGEVRTPLPPPSKLINKAASRESFFGQECSADVGLEGG